MASPLRRRAARHASEAPLMASARRLRARRAPLHQRLPALDDEARAPALPLRQVFARFWPYTRGHRAMMAVGTAMLLLGVPLEALGIWMFKVLIDNVLQPADFGAFPRVAIEYVVLTVLMGAVSFGSGQTLARVS